MNIDGLKMNARRAASRQKDAVEQSFNKRRDIDSLMRERNQSAGQQVRSIGGSVRGDVYASFGGSRGGTRVSP